MEDKSSIWPGEQSFSQLGCGDRSRGDWGHKRSGWLGQRARKRWGEPGSGKPHRSTKMPACTACTMLRNLGFSSALRPLARVCWVKVEASQSRTSEGTASDRSSRSSSSVSRICLGPGEHYRGKKASASILATQYLPYPLSDPLSPHLPFPLLQCLVSMFLRNTSNRERAHSGT